MQAGAGVDALNPKAAEAALADAPVAVGILQPLLDPLDGDLVDVLGAAAVTLGLLENLLVAGVRGDAPLDTSLATSRQAFGRKWRRTTRAFESPMIVVPRALRFIFCGRLRIPWRM